MKFSDCVRRYSTSASDHALGTLVFFNGMNIALTRIILLNSVEEAIYVHDIQGVVHFKEIIIDSSKSAKNSLINVISNSKCNNKRLGLSLIHI